MNTASRASRSSRTRAGCGSPAADAGNRRETAREDEEPGVGHHPMLGADAPFADMPESDQRLERLDRAVEPVRAEAVDRLLHLESGRNERRHDRTRAEGDRGDVEEMPRLRQIDDEPVDVPLRE